MTTYGATRRAIIDTIDTFKSNTGVSDRALSIAACNDTRVVSRLRKGMSVTTQSIERLEAVMDHVWEHGSLPIRQAPEETAVSPAVQQTEADVHPFAQAIAAEEARVREVMFPWSPLPEEPVVETLADDGSVNPLDWAAAMSRV